MSPARGNGDAGASSYCARVLEDEGGNAHPGAATSHANDWNMEFAWCYKNVFVFVDALRLATISV